MPACWAPTPLDCGVRFGPAFDQIDRKNPLPLSPHAKRELIRSNLRHAHPDWWIPRPGRGARVRLSGVLENETLDFKLPALRVLGDYVVGSRSGTRELIPQAILLFANERRLCVTYRVSFLVRYEQGQERCFRLRTEEGWYAD